MNLVTDVCEYFDMEWLIVPSS